MWCCGAAASAAWRRRRPCLSSRHCPIVLGAFAALTGHAQIEPTTATILSLVFQTARRDHELLCVLAVAPLLTSRLMLLSLLTPLFGGCSELLCSEIPSIYDLQWALCWF